MIPGMNSRKAAQLMKRMGIQQTEIPAEEVIIRTSDKDIIISNPQVSKVNMMGQQTFQVVGEIEERERTGTPDISEDDIKTVMDQTGADEETARSAIMQHNGDLAEAILELKNG